MAEEGAGRGGFRTMRAAGAAASEAPPEVEVRVRFFARYRELAGAAERTVRVESGATVGDLVARLRTVEGLTALPAEPAVAVNLDYAVLSRRLEAGDEVALIPPVAGGTGAAAVVRTAIVEEAIDPTALLEGLGSRADGALVLFVGRVRNRNRGRRVTALGYESYREMAERELRAIAEEALEGQEASAVVAVHRVGRLEPGEPSVAVAVAAPHRAQAYAASRTVIEAIKERLPVWKRESYADGSESWVAPAETERPDEGAPARGTTEEPHVQRSAGVSGSGS